MYNNKYNIELYCNVCKYNLNSFYFMNSLLLKTHLFIKELLSEFKRFFHLIFFSRDNTINGIAPEVFYCDCVSAISRNQIFERGKSLAIVIGIVFNLSDRYISFKNTEYV